MGVRKAIRRIKKAARDGAAYLDLSVENLTSLPPELFELKNLTTLYLSYNKLTEIPPEISRLKNLTELDLSFNQLTEIPPEISRLKNLTGLYLFNNQLTEIPPEISRLKNLTTLDLDSNPNLASPPPEVVKQGTKAVLAYLHDLLKEAGRQWISKLLLVGEGGVGKTSLLRALRGEPFIEGLDTTHGVDVEKLELPHPTETDVTMQLNTWDFGGQQIYHATHQFFLTKKSLFILVWDARHGWEAGKLNYWLDTIQVKAPDSPVLIVAAHTDERDADIPLQQFLSKYKQIVGHHDVSNKKGTGIDALRKAIAEVAGDLPLMGKNWPANWLEAANEIRASEEYSIEPKKLYSMMRKHKVMSKSAVVLAQWLHELGDILYFQDDEELSDCVILNPEWVTEAISRVLESSEVINKNGIFTRQHMDELWTDIDQGTRDHFLRLMEKFDLSYRTLENRDISLVVERLPLDPPSYQYKWNSIKNTSNCKEISMRFTLSSVPAGIPTYFIARSHRFTTRTHWRMGALFADYEDRHCALVEAHEYDRHVQLSIRGPTPYNFFDILRDGFELTLRRFPGLRIKRTIPCPGHDGKPCPYEFDLRQLEKAYELERPTVECQETFKLVSLPELLFGLHISTQVDLEKLIKDLETKLDIHSTETRETLAEILNQNRDIIALTQRGFTSLFNAAQQLEESHCPSVFVVIPRKERKWLKDILGQKMDIQLYCEAPGHWHPALEGGRYSIGDQPRWLRKMAPYISKLANVVKYVAPLAGPIAGIVSNAFQEEFKHQLKLMDELAKNLSYDLEVMAMRVSDFVFSEEPNLIEAAQLRVLRAFLDEVDHVHHWGGLKKVLTPEGHYLWLCEHHAKEYKPSVHPPHSLQND